MTERREQPGRLAFGDFFDHLRSKGFVIGIDQQLRVQQLLARIEGECSPEDLRTLLCPIIAGSQEEQRRFYEEFDRFFPLFRPVAEDPVRPIEPIPGPSVEPVAPSTRPRSTARRVALLAAAVVSVVLICLIWLQLQSRKPAAETTPTPTPSVIPTVEPTTSPGKIRVETVRGGPGVTPPDPATYRDPVIEKQRSLRGLAVLAPLAGFLLWMLWRWMRQRPVIEKSQGRRPPFSVPIELKPERWRVDHLPEFAQVARMLRRRQLNEQLNLDLPATIEATVAAQGYPRFRYRQGDRLPEYLILINRVSEQDHQAEWFSQITHALAQSGLFVQIWFYNQDPRVCRSAETGKSDYLTQLQRRFPGHRIIIFGDGRRLLDPLTGDPASWVDLLREWPEGAILTPLSPLEWNRYEETLERLFPVFPGRLAGLVRLAEHYDQPLRGLDIGVDIDEAVPPEVAYGVTTAELEAYLGPDGYRWLCACAFYPELYWDLTLSLARVAHAGQAAELDEALLWRLIRLPWFREGTIPDEIRLPLIESMERDDPQTARAIREHLIGILEAQSVEEGTFAADERRLDIVVQKAALAQTRRERKKALREVEHLSPGELRRDFTLIRLIEEKPTSLLSLILPARLRKVFYPDGLPIYPVKWWGGLIGATLVALVLLGGVEGVVRYRKTKTIIPPISTASQPSPTPETTPEVPAPSPSPGLRPSPTASRQAPAPGGPSTTGSGEVSGQTASPADDEVSIEMVTIPGGSFLMGSPPGENGRESDEGPQRRVTVRQFEMSKYEVTQKLWLAVMGSNPSNFKGEDLPVENVSWNDVQEFCRRLNERLGLTAQNGYRLPTEAQWEYAARAGTTTRYSFGNDESKLGEYAWFDGNSGKRTHPVGQKMPNSFGLYDMPGNVFEWCEDDNHESYDRAPADDRAWVDNPRGSLRVVRGGGWGYGAVGCRSAYRIGIAPGRRIGNLGFRLVRIGR